MWQYYNPNPTERIVGDCAVRAICKALNLDWETAYAKIVANGYQMGDMPSSNSVWGALLRQNGFYRKFVPNDCPDCMTAKEFLKQNPKGTFVFVFNNHTATAIDGVLYDAWNSEDEVIDYIWYRKDENNV